MCPLDPGLWGPKFYMGYNNNKEESFLICLLCQWTHPIGTGPWGLKIKTGYNDKTFLNCFFVVVSVDPPHLGSQFNIGYIGEAFLNCLLYH